MTPEDVTDRVEAIRVAAGDDEKAHAMEDALHGDVLRAIANRDCEDPTLCAFLALETAKIDFERWFA